MLGSFWVVSGVIYLFLLTVQDLKYNMKVDQRHNFFMLGMTVGILGFVHRPLWYIFVVVLSSIIIVYFMIKFGFGKGDGYTMLWAFMGFAYLNLQYALLFVACVFLIALCFIVFFKVSARLGKSVVPVIPFYPGLLASFVLCGLLLAHYT